ncbi:hypothetical protein SAMN03159444_00143 [Pseudomonas sp. NFACC02]|uniref:DUF1643 domain-containing protein n=1 Tax=Pseudomonas sp. NFACC02 TaxID=1566250 RepID=UPI0008CBCC68|nr:DUF1643 domain-containing protein [Pseudomonas sp. NFACC02]SEP58889.1 hypothetical protein SAMN03159444_00143 [Pseudomonas sp. NFACC02]
MSAIISECGLYRYRLDRDCGLPFEGSKVFAYFGINPSTADATLDDATVRKWRGFTVRNGGHRFIVGNVFSFRATDVQVLRKTLVTMGPDHHKHLDQIIREADVLVPCWGSSDKLEHGDVLYMKDLLNTLLESGKPVLHFGTTKSGQPKHPLMLGYDTQLIPWVTP